MKKTLIAIGISTGIFISLSYQSKGQQLIKSYSFDLAKDKEARLVNYQITGQDFGIISLEGETKGIYMVANSMNNVIAPFSVSIADNKQVDPFIRIHYDMTQMGKGYKKKLPNFIPLSHSIIGFHQNGPRNILFSESALDGSNWKIIDELSLPNNEIFIAQELRDDCYYLVSCDRVKNSINLYTKRWGDSLEKKTWEIDFSDTSSNGIKWRADFKGISTLFEGFYNKSFTYNFPSYKNGQFENYWRIRREIKPYSAKNYLHIHINTGFNVTLLFNIPLKSNNFSTTIIDHSTDALKELQKGIPLIEDIKFKPSLGIYKRNHASAFVDSIVLISKIVDLELINLYYHAFTGKLLHAEVLSYMDISNLKNSFVDVDYYADEKFNEYASPARFFELLKISQPELNIAKLDEKYALISIELFPGSRNPDDIFLPMYLARLLKDKKNRPDLISLGRVINMSDFTLQDCVLPKPYTNEKWNKPIKDFLINMDKKYNDAAYLPFEDKAILSVLLKDEGKVDFYIFE